MTSPISFAMSCALALTLPVFAGTAAVAVAQESAAETTADLTWEELIPSEVEFEDPFEELDREQLEYLGFVARIRAMIAAGTDVSEATRRELAEIEDELVAGGVDVDTLLDRRDELRELRRKRASGVVEELHGAQFRLSGYLMPLGVSGGRTTEFLLVPWVAECIHTPPPPANQMIHVIMESGQSFEAPDPHVPVRASGVLYTQQSTQRLFLSDGSSDLDVRYQLRAAHIEVISP